ENEDGQVLLYGETGIKGEKVDAAIAKITDLAVKYGYLDEDNKVVDTIVTSEYDGFANEVLRKVNASITATAANLGLSVTTDGDGAYSLQRKMNEFKDRFPNNQAIQNLTVQKFKLALSVSETGDVSLETAVELNDGQLLEMLKDASANIETYATQAYTEAKTKALAIYEQSTEMAEYAVYTSFYIEKIPSHPMSAYYGGIYQMYASAAKSLDITCDVAELAMKTEDYPLTNEQIDAVVSALGIESADALKNSNGDVTVKSIEAYADKTFKNTPASDALEQTKTALSNALSQAESVIKEDVAETMKNYQPQIEQAMQSAVQTIEALKNVLPTNVKTILNDAMADFKEISTALTEALNDGRLEIAELRAFADRLDVKAQEYLVKMKNDLSDEEWAELEARKKAVLDKMSAQKQAFEKTLDEAAATAKNYLADLKAERAAR
ncbi:MAG: hypothetical protein NC332_01245, partial [Firmicutes bacterium]|nr:hypothetical protein [Bacillota bacterium]